MLKSLVFAALFCFGLANLGFASEHNLEFKILQIENGLPISIPKQKLRKALEIFPHGIGGLAIDTSLINLHGNQCEISEFTANDWVIAYNLKKKALESTKILSSYLIQVNRVLELTIDDAIDLKVSPKQSFLVQGKNGKNAFKLASDLEIGEVLVGKDGFTQHITAIEHYHEHELFYDISLPKGYAIYLPAVDCVVHNIDYERIKENFGPAGAAAVGIATAFYNYSNDEQSGSGLNQSSLFYGSQSDSQVDSKDESSPRKEGGFEWSWPFGGNGDKEIVDDIKNTNEGEYNSEEKSEPQQKKYEKEHEKIDQNIDAEQLNNLDQLEEDEDIMFKDCCKVPDFSSTSKCQSKGADHLMIEN